MMEGARLGRAVPTPRRPWYVDMCEQLTLGTVGSHNWWCMPFCRDICVFILYLVGYCDGM